MITYVISQVHRFLRETLTPATAPRVTLSRTCYIVPLNGTVHRVRRDRACDCGGAPTKPCPAVPLVQDYLAAAGERPLGRHPDTWPESWLQVPSQCPVCDCPTLADRHLDSSHGPGWRCTLDAGHYWRVRLNSLRRALAARRQAPRYPWYDTPRAERQVWLTAHRRLPRCGPEVTP